MGKTLTRFNFPQDEAYNPLGILLARHLTQPDEAQRNATEGTQEENTGDDQPRPEVADAILATSATTPAGELPGLQPTADSEQGGESSGSGDGIVVRKHARHHFHGRRRKRCLGRPTASRRRRG